TLPPWSYFAKLYFEERKEHIRKWNEQNLDKTLKDHCRLLESLRQVEMLSYKRIEEFKCLEGIGNCELFNQGKEKIEIKEYAIEYKLKDDESDDEYDENFDDTIVVVDDIVDVADVVDFDVFVIEIEIADFEVEIEI
ncbi:13556_t:CDS:2, partial [Entrophospora sp. SA101]